jgi:hypothetical protein
MSHRRDRTLESPAILSEATPLLSIWAVQLLVPCQPKTVLVYNYCTCICRLSEQVVLQIIAVDVEIGRDFCVAQDVDGTPG